MNRIAAALALMLGLFAPHMGLAAPVHNATVYKDPACGCCASYADYLRKNGFKVDVVETANMAAVKAKYGVPSQLSSCHTMIVEGYVVEGHVPVLAVKRLLAEKPSIKGIALPGMPMGSPGMSGEKEAPFVIYEITDGPAKVFSTE